MPNIENTYGKNAGKVWKTLEKCGPCNESTIRKKTKLNKQDLYTAIGWLAKENKIWIDNDTYNIGNNNWDHYIGANAGKVWNILYKCEEIDYNYIPKLAEVSEKDALYAIGWLAKEGKITEKKVKPTKTQTRYRLKE